MLTIFEELFLLALDEEKGNILPFAKKTLAHAISGGILAELTLLGKVRSNEKHRLELIDPVPTGDALLDESIQEIKDSEKTRKLAYWISLLSARPKRLRENIGERLVAKNLLFQEDKRFFWRFPSPEEQLPPNPTKYEMKKPLRAAILAGAESDSRTLALLNVASDTGLLSLVFTQDELSMAERRVHGKVFQAALENPVMQTIEEIEQAIIISLEDDLDL